MKWRFAAAFVVCGSQAIAQTTCPTAANLSEGILLTRSEPLNEVLWVTNAEGVLTTAQRDGRDNPNATYHHALLVHERFSEQGTLALRYPAPIADLDQLDSLGDWTSEVELFANDKTVDVGMSSLRFMGTLDHKVGACSYKTWVVRSQLIFESGRVFNSEQLYAPALGAIVANIVLDENFEAVQGLIFNRIETIQ